MLIAKIKDNTYNYEVRTKNNKLDIIRYSNFEVKQLEKNEVIALFQNIIEDVDISLLDYFDKYSVYATLSLTKKGTGSKEKTKELNTPNFKIISGRSFIFIVALFLSLNIALLSTGCSSKVEGIISGSNITDNIDKDTSTAEDDLNRYEYLISELNKLNGKDYNDLILRNNNLSDFQKKLISNPELIEAVLKVVKDNQKIDLFYNLDNLQIVEYTMDEETDAVGFVDPLNRNIIHLENMSDEFQTSALPHEFIHVLQASSPYPYILEAAAEITANEYFDNEIKTYVHQVSSIRTLMEIIGPTPIWELSFNGDDTALIEAINTYLDEEDAKTLLSLFMQSPLYEAEEIKENSELLNNLLSKMYTNKYGTNIEDDETIRIINRSSRVYRYYFNEEKIKQNEKDGGFYIIDLYALTEKTNAKYYVMKDNVWKEITFEQYVQIHGSSNGKDTKVEFNDTIDGYEVIGSTWATNNGNVVPCVLARKHIPSPSINEKFPEEHINTLKK